MDINISNVNMKDKIGDHVKNRLMVGKSKGGMNCGWHDHKTKGIFKIHISLLIKILDKQKPKCYLLFA